MVAPAKRPVATAPAGPGRWEWSDSEGPIRAMRELRDHGLTLFHMPDAIEQSRTPELLVDRLFTGQARPVKVVPNLIRVDPAGIEAPRFYANTGIAALMHVDSPIGGLITPSIQIMVCRRPAERGGESTVLDAWKLVNAIELADPPLHRHLFSLPRRIGILRDTVWGPTISLRRGHLVCHHGGVPPTDEVGRLFREWVERSPPIEFRAEAGDVYINDNHRMLHGRRAFTDARREFQRINVWFAEPMPAPSPLVARATRAAAAIRRRLAAEPRWIQEAFAAVGCDDPTLAVGWLEPRPEPPGRDQELARVLARLTAPTKRVTGARKRPAGSPRRR